MGICLCSSMAECYRNYEFCQVSWATAELQDSLSPSSLSQEHSGATKQDLITLMTRQWEKLEIQYSQVVLGRWSQETRQFYFSVFSSTCLDISIVRHNLPAHAFTFSQLFLVALHFFCLVESEGLPRDFVLSWFLCYSIVTHCSLFFFQGPQSGLYVFSC